MKKENDNAIKSKYLEEWVGIFSLWIGVSAFEVNQFQTPLKKRMLVCDTESSKVITTNKCFQYFFVFGSDEKHLYHV